MQEIVSAVITWAATIMAVSIAAMSIYILFHAARSMVGTRRIDIWNLVIAGVAVLALPVAIATYPHYMLQKATEGINGVTGEMPAFVDGMLTLIDVAKERAGHDLETPEPLPTEYLMVATPEIVILTATPTTQQPTVQPMAQPTPTPCYVILGNGRSLSCPPTPTR